MNSKKLFCNVVAMAQSCLRGNHFGTTGLNIRTPYGCKGIGKQLAANIIEPKMIQICVKFNTQNPSIDREIEKSLRCYYPDWPTEGRPIDRARAVLDHIDRHALVIVEEIDQLYTIDNEEALSCLTTLVHIANQHPGRFCAVVCGSSLFVPDLITKSPFALKYLTRKFPLVKNAMDLNDTKFNLIKIEK